jgi:hypothetical protein
MKLAILGTNEARNIVYDETEVGGIKSATASDFLLQLLQDDYEVVIITTRHTFYHHDKCWLGLIKEENIYVPMNTEEPICVMNSEFIKNWREVFQRFGLNKPTGDYSEDSWLHWKWAARDQGVVTSSYDLNKK